MLLVYKLTKSALFATARVVAGTLAAIATIAITGVIAIITLGGTIVITAVTGNNDRSCAGLGGSNVGAAFLALGIDESRPPPLTDALLLSSIVPDGGSAGRYMMGSSSSRISKFTCPHCPTDYIGSRTNSPQRGTAAVPTVRFAARR